MRDIIKSFMNTPLSRPAMAVPTAIMLIFSVFNLTAPQDPARVAANLTMGIVNQDEGLSFPPIRVSSLMLRGLGEQMPFATAEFDDIEAAEAALEAGEISLAVLFPPDFSANAMGGEVVGLSILNSQHLTIAEAQMASQVPTMMRLGLAAGVTNLRLASAEGRLPSGEMPVEVTTRTLVTAESPAAMTAPFVMLYTTWLAALVGGILFAVSTRRFGDARDRSKIRSVLPIVSFGVSTLVLSIVVGWTVNWGLMLPVWGNVFATTLLLHWFLSGVIALFGLWVILLLLPLAFYQSQVGGVMMPAAAAPDWLTNVTNWAPFHAVGAGYRTLVHGMGSGLPWAWLLAAGVLGLAMIWIGELARANR